MQKMVFILVVKNLIMQAQSGNITQINESINFMVTLHTIFLTDLIASAGNLGTTWESIDQRCMDSPNRPNDGRTYMAMIVGTKEGITRRACINENCGGGGIAENQNWALKPNVEYYWSNGEFLFTTNESSIFVFGDRQGGTPPLGADFAWTGLEADWTTTTSLCGPESAAWTSSDPGYFGRMGSGANDQAWISHGDDYCDLITPGLYCVSQ